jgi:hypothetical protein
MILNGKRTFGKQVAERRVVARLHLPHHQLPLSQQRVDGRQRREREERQLEEDGACAWTWTIDGSTRHDSLEQDSPPLAVSDLT